MQQHEIQHFLQRYFVANNCEVIEKSADALTIKLSEALDKQLMNRPFYWHYVEKTGRTPETKQLHLITNPTQQTKKTDGEIIYFGSPRLHQILQSTTQLAKYIRLYEQHHLNEQTALLPWLCLNIKVSYVCDRKKDVFHSIGLQLMSGQMRTNFHDLISELSLTPKIPDHTFTLSPLIKLASGLKRIKAYLHQRIVVEDTSWATAARERWQQDNDLLDHFYADIPEKGESYYNEKAALKLQYEPKIIIEVINGGLFYLTENALNGDNRKR